MEQTYLVTLPRQCIAPDAIRLDECRVCDYLTREITKTTIKFKTK
jgi:hypothetical protein